MKKFCLGLLLLTQASLFGGSVIAQQAITTDEIIQSLKPKVRTRGPPGPSLKAEDAAFIERIKHTTRGLTVEERTQLSDIVSTAGLPSIDLEVMFALNSATLDQSAIETLQRLGAALKAPELSNASFLIAGHTDARGTLDYNQKLSEDRARVVKSFLSTNFQVLTERLISVGYGQEQLKNQVDPFADENRRVKIINLGKN
jgi:outer membrane protein OmpA-like peptidoglycan-associated protein